MVAHHAGRYFRARQETVPAVYELVLTDRLLKE
jgi:hypothetical protein